MISQEQFEETLERLRAAKVSLLEESLKTITSSSVPGTATQYQPFNLDPVGKVLTPEFTPFSNSGAYEVKMGESGDSYEYRAITAKNTAKSGGAALNATDARSTSQSTSGRANVINFSFLTRKKFRAKHAPEAAVDWELYESSGPFNALGKTIIVSLINAREIEERRILFDDSQALGTPVAPVSAAVVGGGSLTNVAHTVKCIALNYHGWWYWLADGANSAGADITPVTTFGLPGGAVQGESIASAASNSQTPAAGGHLNVTTTPIPGAYAYLWLADAATGTYKYATVTTTPFATITAVSSLTVAVPTVDGSNFDLDGFPVVWDGLFAQIVRDTDTALRGPYVSLNSVGGAFSTTGAGSGVTQIESVLRQLAQVTKVSPEMAIMSMGTLGALSNVMIGSSSPAYRFNIEATGPNGEIKAGSVLSEIRNQYMGGKTVSIMPHPLMPDGKIIFYTKTIDYPNSGVATNLGLHCTKRFQQQYFALVADVAPPGPWAIKSYGTPALIWPKACAVIDDALPLAS